MKKSAIRILSAGIVWASMTASSTALAMPITYQFDGTFGAFDNGDPLGLENAAFTLLYRIDTMGVTPFFDGPGTFAPQETLWPASATTADLTIIGSTNGGDGVFAAATVGRFMFTDNYDDGMGTALGDIILFPETEYIIAAEDFTLSPLSAFFPEAFNNPVGPIIPYTFEFSDGEFNSPGSLAYYDSQFSPEGSRAPRLHQAISGVEASSVPAPATVSLLGLSLGLIGWSRRKRPLKHLN